MDGLMHASLDSNWLDRRIDGCVWRRAYHSRRETRRVGECVMEGMDVWWVDG